jgi:hypothetical protein
VIGPALADTTFVRICTSSAWFHHILPASQVLPRCPCPLVENFDRSPKKVTST